MGSKTLQHRFRALARPVATRLWDINVTGLERLPKQGPALLCPNHISFLDSAFLMLSVDRQISFVGKAEYLDNWKTKWLFPAMGMIPIDRSGGERSQAALEAAEAALLRGELFGIFPEGTRSRDGYLYKGRTGAARLALKVGCPIFPVGIVGTDQIQPCDAKVPKLRGECSITIGRPIRTERYAGRKHDHLTLRSLTDEVMFEIRAMTDQQYRDVYAGTPVDETPTTLVPAEPARVGSVVGS